MLAKLVLTDDGLQLISDQHNARCRRRPPFVVVVRLSVSVVVVVGDHTLVAVVVVCKRASGVFFSTTSESLHRSIRSLFHSFVG